MDKLTELDFNEIYFSPKFQNNESEIKLCEKSEKISLDPIDLFKEINLSNENIPITFSPTIKPINKFYLPSGHKTKGLLDVLDRNSHKSGEKKIFNEIKRTIINNIKESNLKTKMNQCYNISTIKPKVKLSSKLNSNKLDSHFNSQLKFMVPKSNQVYKNRFELIKSSRKLTLLEKRNDQVSSINMLNNVKVNMFRKNETPLYSNNNINDDYFYSILSNVKNNKNVQVIAEKVKRITQKHTSKTSLIYNLNNDYKQNKEDLTKKNLKDKLRDMMNYKEQDNINDHNDIEISSNIYSIDQGSILFDKVGINFDDEGNKNIINLNSSKLKHLL